MIYLSAQPDDYYFLWQLELQLFNFKSLGIPSEDVHVLLGHDPRRSLHTHFSKFISEFGYGNFFIYPDLRQRRGYLSSIRPYLIKEHVKRLKWLNETAIFYHDSDIIFRKKPDFSHLLSDYKWYASSTESYISSKCITEKSDSNLIYEMCEVIGIEPDAVLSDSFDIVGAQYLLKNTTYDFWNNLEQNCENIYSLMVKDNKISSERHYLTTQEKPSSYDGVQSWCSDMWAILWQCYAIGQPLNVHKDLDFCWPQSPIEEWEKTNILHYAGEIGKKNASIFYKPKYYHYSPFYDDHSQINPDCCSIKLISCIDHYIQYAAKNKIDLSDVTFIIPITVEVVDDLENIKLVVNYLSKYVKTNIIIIEFDLNPQLGEVSWPNGVKYKLRTDASIIFGKATAILDEIRDVDTSIFSIYEPDVIIPINQIISSIELINESKLEYVFPSNGKAVKVDFVFKEMFSKLMDPEVLEYNIGKFNIDTKESPLGVAFFNRNAMLTYLEENIGNSVIPKPKNSCEEKETQVNDPKITKGKGSLFRLPSIVERKENLYSYSEIFDFLTKGSEMS